MDPKSSDNGDMAVPVLEETISVAKREVSTGKVRVTTKTESYEEMAEATLDRHAVDVIRIEINRPIDDIPPTRTEGDTTIVPIVEERLIVVKQLFLAEELHIRQHVEQENVKAPVTLRRQRAVVEHLDASDSSSGKPT